MAFKLNHVATAEEASANSGGFEPWRAGDYDFQVHEAAEDVSKAGNEQIKLTLWVFNDEGNKRTVFDYLQSGESAAWKVRHFCEAIGILADYERGVLNVEDMVEKTGRLRLHVKPAQGIYAANNSVGDYIPAAEQPAKAARPKLPASTQAGLKSVMASHHKLDDDIPF